MSRPWFLIALFTVTACADDGAPPSTAWVSNKDGGTILACPYAGAVDWAACSPLDLPGLANPIKLVFLGGTAWISSFGDAGATTNTIFDCRAGNGTISDCRPANFTGYDFPVNLAVRDGRLVVPSYDNGRVLAYEPGSADPVASLAVDSPSDVFFVSDDDALVVSQSDGDANRILACAVDGVALSDCVTALDLGSEVALSIGENAGWIYLTLPGANRVRKCARSGRELVDCEDVGDAALFDYPYGITFRDGAVYVPNRQPGVDSIVICRVAADGDLGDCRLETAGGRLDGPTWVVFR